MPTFQELTVRSPLTPDVQRAPSDARAPEWNLATLVAFRFGLVYFGLYVLTTQMLGSLFPLPRIDVPVLATLPPFRGVILWLGAHLFGISHRISYQDTGSGDKLFDWVHAGVVLLIAVLAVAVWTAIDKRRERNARIYAWFRLVARFALGTSLLSYGLAKAIPLQMPSPYLQRLIEPFGNFSPMGVLWSSIGASRAYEIFAGSAESLAAILLFFPRTATLGALVALADVIEVLTLNLTYDVPVKLFAFHLVVLSLIVLAPNIRQIWNFLLMRRGSSLIPEPTIGGTARRQRTAFIAQVVFALYVIAVGIDGSVHAWSQYGGGAPHSPLYGIWNVEQMSTDGHGQPALLTDSTRFRRVLFDFPAFALFYSMDDALHGYGVKIDTVAHTIALSTFGKQHATYSWTYARPSADRLILDGVLSNHSIHMELKRQDEKSFLLESRGFHLVSEYPFNR